MELLQRVMPNAILVVLLYLYFHVLCQAHASCNQQIDKQMGVQTDKHVQINSQMAAEKQSKTKNHGYPSIVIVIVVIIIITY